MGRCTGVSEIKNLEIHDDIIYITFDHCQFEREQLFRITQYKDKESVIKNFNTGSYIAYDIEDENGMYYHEGYAKSISKEEFDNNINNEDVDIDDYLNCDSDGKLIVTDDLIEIIATN